MPGKRVDYDQIASTYDQRFAENRRDGTATALLNLARELSAERILEVGCGTGRWLADLCAVAQHLYGLDLSAGMLQQARRRGGSYHLVRGRAGQLPFPGAAFDLVYCVNAIHHFDHPRVFISEARRLLRPGGALAVAGMDPHGRRDCWYVYDYFEGVYETDLARFPSWETVMEWMAEEGLGGVRCRLVERILDHKVGQDVLSDRFLHKDSCSQLALLSDEAYAAGLRRIEAALRKADVSGETLLFVNDISIAMIVGRSVGQPGPGGSNKRSSVDPT